MIQQYQMDEGISKAEAVALAYKVSPEFEPSDFSGHFRILLSAHRVIFRLL